MTATLYITIAAHAADIAGQRFGRLVALGPVGRARGREIIWECRCDCGALTSLKVGSLRSGTTRSCGCLQRELLANRVRQHGDTGSPEFRAWQAMKTRCGNRKQPHYNNYGGRGITVCERWRNSFDAFLEDMGPKPSDKHSLDRIDNEKSYSPENCRWTTRFTQSRNHRRNRLLTINGRTQCFADWCNEYGIKQETARARIDRYGWSETDALTRPVGR